MKWPKSDLARRPEGDAASRSLVEAASIEIAAQSVLLWLVVLPTAIVIVPATLFALCLYIVAHLMGELSDKLQWIGSWSEAKWWTLLVTSGIVSLAVSGAQFIARRRSSYSPRERRLQPISGGQGETLSQIVAELWRTLAKRREGPPLVMWFSNFNVLASASENDRTRIIEVSSALWERAVRRDAVAIGILAHEMAHLVYRDRRRLRPLEGMVTAARLVLNMTMAGVVATAAIAGIVFAVQSSGPPMHSLAWREVSVVAGAALVLLIPSLANLIIRRQAALITALIEIRADTVAGIWTNGLAGFARSLAQDPSVKSSSLAEIRHSILSPDLTHLSNSERIGLLSDTTRLATPKLRYFALSLALPFLLPLNPYTPLLAGGAFDHMLVSAVVVVAHVATIAMIVSAAPSLCEPLSWRTTAKLGVFLCLASVLSQINLYQIGYLLTHLATAIASPSGFGPDPLTAEGVVGDIAIAFSGLQENLVDASGGFLFLLAVACSAASLRAQSVLARQQTSELGSRSSMGTWAAPSIAAGIVAFASTHDEWRSAEAWPFSLGADWFAVTRSVPWVRLCAPELASMAVLVLQIVVLRIFVNRRGHAQ
ncbi:hypothetical protein [Sinorhizobium meliloti]|uniref:hypothetical protein n=1 Tax=Rhizobium meliloti TaxID=382 RepID=UPI0003F5361E|nr:hypothetical protein [Sinorhizobium meliloti]UFX13153.1 hypothetical protein SmelRRI128_34310 [Sinorhizobium meliloti]